MRKDAKARFDAIWSITQTDRQYYDMLMELRRMDKQYERVVRGLPEAEQMVIRDFVSQCEAMSWRMLEVACSLMVFPCCEETKPEEEE